MGPIDLQGTRFVFTVFGCVFLFTKKVECVCIGVRVPDFDVDFLMR